MDTILLWPPVLWAARICLLMALVVIGIGGALFFARILHPRNLLALLTGEAPAIFPADGRWGVVELGCGFTVRCIPASVLSESHPANGRPAASPPKRPQPN
jgi:hypothetical protein